MIYKEYCKVKFFASENMLMSTSQIEKYAVSKFIYVYEIVNKSVILQSLP